MGLKISTTMTQVKASLKYLRIAPRKVRLVANMIKGLPVARAEEQLKFLPKRATLPVLKLLRSAIANAEHNFRLSKKSLHVASIMVDGGPTLKRGRPRAFGRSFLIRKRTSHVTIILEGVAERAGKAEEKDPSPKEKKQKKKA